MEWKQYLRVFECISSKASESSRARHFSNQVGRMKDVEKYALQKVHPLS